MITSSAVVIWLWPTLIQTTARSLHTNQRTGQLWHTAGEVFRANSTQFSLSGVISEKFQLFSCVYRNFCSILLIFLQKLFFCNLIMHVLTRRKKKKNGLWRVGRLNEYEVCKVLLALCQGGSAHLSKLKQSLVTV